MSDGESQGERRGREKMMREERRDWIIQGLCEKRVNTGSGAQTTLGSSAFCPLTVD
jgi:hypothetical protein